MKKCKNCSEEVKDDLTEEGLCEDCADEAEQAAEELRDEETDV